MADILYRMILVNEKGVQAAGSFVFSSCCCCWVAEMNARNTRPQNRRDAKSSEKSRNKSRKETLTPTAENDQTPLETSAEQSNQDDDNKASQSTVGDDEVSE